jgi:hypothetical protein
VCPLVSVRVRSMRAGRVENVPLSAKSCCQLPVLLSAKKLSIHMNEQPQSTSAEAIGDSSFYTFMEKEVPNRQLDIAKDATIIPAYLLE